MATPNRYREPLNVLLWCAAMVLLPVLIIWGCGGCAKPVSSGVLSDQQIAERESRLWETGRIVRLENDHVGKSEMLQAQIIIAQSSERTAQRLDQFAERITALEKFAAEAPSKACVIGGVLGEFEERITALESKAHEHKPCKVQ